MANKINLPLRRFIEQKVQDNFKDIDFRRGTAFNDLFAKVAAVLQQPFRHELNMLRINQSILNFEFMSNEDIELLLGNLFVNRSDGTRSTGIIRIYFTQPGDYSFGNLFFTTASGLRFRNVNSIRTSVEQLLPNRQEDGTYALDVVCEAEFPGSKYAVKAGEITLVENQPNVIFRIENSEDFSGAFDNETNADLFDKARTSISVRNLINDSSIKTVLYNQFGAIRDIHVAGAGDTEMVRDLITVTGTPDYQINIGGKTDVYVDTTGISSYELNISYIPENLLVSAISGFERLTTYDYNSGSVNDVFFTDPFNQFIVDTDQFVVPGNKLEIDRTEFGLNITDEFTVEAVIDANQLRISAGTRLDSLDTILPYDGNWIEEFMSGDFINTIEVAIGDYARMSPSEFWKINYVDPKAIEVIPSNKVLVTGGFVANTPYDPNARTTVISQVGIGGISPNEAVSGDQLYIQTGSAAGTWEIFNRVSDNEVWVATDPVAGTIDFSATEPQASNPSETVGVGDYVILASTGEAFEVVGLSPLTLDRFHGQGATVGTSVYFASNIIEGNIGLEDEYAVYRPAKKISITAFSTPIALPALNADVDNGDYFLQYPTGADIKRGDLIVDLASGEHRVVAISDDGVNLYAQIVGSWTGGTIAASGTPDVLRFETEEITNTNVLMRRQIAGGECFTLVSSGSTSIPEVGIGYGARPGDYLVVHDGPAVGKYTIDAGWNRDPNNVLLSTGLLGDLEVGNQFSVIRGDTFGGIAMGDTLFVPTNGGADFGSFVGAFPNSNETHFIHITAGPNQGVYEVVEYLDENRVRIGGNLISHGESIIDAWESFNNVTISGATTINEGPLTPFIDVLAGDTLIIDSDGEKSYHYIESATNSTLDIYPELSEQLVPGSQQYQVLRSAINPVIVTDAQKELEVQITPVFYDRRVEGTDGTASDSSFTFRSLSTDFPSAFGAVSPVGYELYILSGTHARPEPYIIQGFNGTDGLDIDPVLTVQTAEFLTATGFVGPTSPANSEVFEVKAITNDLSNLSYRIIEDHAYFEDGFFQLPILAVRDIYTIDPLTGDISEEPLVDGVDFTISVFEQGTRYSPLENVKIQFLRSDLAFTPVRIRYYSDPNVEVINSFLRQRGNRNTNNDILCKRMESTFIDVTVNMSGSISVDQAETVINQYITTRKSTDNIEASDIIKDLYDAGANYVDTESLLLAMTHYTSTGEVIKESSRTIVGSGNTATYIPGSISVFVIPS